MTNTPGVPDHAETKSKWVIGDNLYDFLRKIVNFGIPAGAGFYVSIAGILHLLYALEVAGVAAALVIFLNVLLYISKKNYKEMEEQARGTVYINTKDPEGAVVGLDLEGYDPDKLAKQRTVTLNVNSQ